MQKLSPYKGLQTILSKAQEVWSGKDTAATALKTLLSRFLILGINIVTSIITARMLGPDGRGEQTAMMLGAGLLATLMTLGIPRSLIYNVKRSPESKSQFFAVSLLLSTVLGVITGLVTLLLLPQWLSKFSPEVIQFTRWLTLNSPLIIIQTTCLSALEAYELFSISNIFLLLVHSSALLMLIGLIISHSMNPFTAAFAYVFAATPTAIGLLIYVWRLYKPIWTDLGASFRSLINYGFRAYGIDLLSILAQQADQVFVVGLLPPKYVGMYVIAVSLARILNVFQTSMVTILFPKIAAKSLGEVILVTGQATRITAVAMSATSLVVAACGPFLLTLLYGAEFQEAVSVLRILILEAVISSTTLVLAQAFMALGRPGIVTMLQAIGVGLSVPLMILLIPHFGLVGAGLALLASAIVRLACILACFPAILKTAPPNLILTKADLEYFRHKLLHPKA